MKKLKLLASLFCCLAITLSAFTYPVYAKSNQNLDVKFGEFYFSTNDYDKDKVYIEYSKLGLSEIAEIKDKTTGKVLETMTVTPTDTSRKFRSSQYVYPYTFKRFSKYGDITVQLSVNVELYYHGWYRCINSVRGTYLGISNSFTTTAIEDKNVNVWAVGDKFPAIELFYAYNGTLVARVDSSVSSGLELKLLDSGFNLSSTMGETHYYRRAFDSTGTIKLYNR